MTTENFLPAEWYPQDAVLVTWPHQESAWQLMLAEVEQTYLDLTATLSHYQPVLIQTHSSIDISVLLQSLTAHQANLSNCHFIRADSNDTWTRDHGPICVLTKNGVEVLDFIFDGWGGKFDASLDNKLNQLMLQSDVLVNLRLVNGPLEGVASKSLGNAK